MKVSKKDKEQSEEQLGLITDFLKNLDLDDTTKDLHEEGSVGAIILIKNKKQTLTTVAGRAETLEYLLFTALGYEPGLQEIMERAIKRRKLYIKSES